MKRNKKLNHKEIYEQKAKALTKENAYLKGMIDSIPGDIYWKDCHGKWLGVNQRGAATLIRMGFIQTKEEVIGKTDLELFGKETGEKYRENDMAVIENREENSCEERVTLPNGSSLVQLSIKRPIKDKYGHIIGIVGNTVDISYLKKIEEDLLQAKLDAEIASKAKSEFISNMEHDLRTPFSGISGMAHLIHSNYAKNHPELRPLIEIMIKSCSQWEAVHNRIFDALVIDNPCENRIEKISLSNILKEIYDEMSAIVYLKRLKLSIDNIPRDMDNLKSDKLKLYLILSSLISNAINFTETGCIKVSARKVEKGLEILVEDSGIGIPEEKIKHIFDKFTKLSPSNKHGGKFQGIGMGLYASKKYAGHLGYKLSVKSQVGVGSVSGPPHEKF